VRVKITLACGECKQRNYNTMKNKKKRPGQTRNEKILQVLPEAYYA